MTQSPHLSPAAASQVVSAVVAVEQALEALHRAAGAEAKADPADRRPGSAIASMTAQLERTASGLRAFAAAYTVPKE
jgi:hypothetical protein